MDELFWGNKILKTIDMSFTPLAEMTPEAWAILDYGSLRPVAMNRIARMAVAGKLIGFYDVKVIAKARNKSNYMQPADDKMLRDYGDGDNEVFGYQADGNIKEALAATTIDDIATANSLLGIGYGVVFITALIKFIKEKEVEIDNAEEPGSVEALDELAAAKAKLRYDRAKLEEAEKNLVKLRASHALFNAPYDYALAATIMALRALVLADIQEVSDAQDEVDYTEGQLDDENYTEDQLAAAE